MTNKNKKAYLNQNEENEMEIYGYELCLFRTIVTWIFYFLTLGLLRLFYHWFQQLQLYSTHRRCSLQDAQKILIVDKFMGKHKTYFVKEVKNVSVTNSSSTSKISAFLEIETKSVAREFKEIKMFSCKKTTYIYDSCNDQYYKLIGLEKNMHYSELHSRSQGLTSTEESDNRLAYEKNIIETPINTIPELLILELLNPFYIFQLFSIIIFICEFYYSTVVGIIVATVFVVLSSVYQTRTNQKNLHGTVRSNNEVTVYRKITTHNDNFEEKLEIISSTDLVPGDVIIIPEEGCEMQSDCVLLEGGTCIVNESMLTGESVPVTKTSLPISSKLFYDVEIDKNHTLYCGTRVVQIRHHGNGLIKALVVRTGFLTTKGQLVRSILYPPPTDYRFDRDAYKFLGILGIVATIGFIYTLLYNLYHQQPVYDTIIKGLDLYTTVISPAIPAVMTVGRLFAVKRLKKERIFCINSRVINVTGSIDCVCFDKTGTLTEDGMDLYAVIPLKSNDVIELDDPIHSPVSNTLKAEENKDLLYGMVTCHSVSLIHNQFYGDPLDVKMFESSNWIIKEHNSLETVAQYGTYVPTVVQSPTDSCEIGIIHQYQFSSTLQRMSVITKNAHEKDYVIYCKGSPEKIVSLSKSTSVPQNIFSILKTYTKKGYRVIAIGKRVLSAVDVTKIKNLERDEVEMELEFVGLIIFENRVKNETFPVIQTLKNANMKIVMITGDNIQTAISVACECGIIENNKEIVDISASKDTENNHFKLIYSKNNDYELQKDSVSAFSPTSSLPEEHIEMVSSCYVLTGDTWAVIRNKFPDQIERIVKYGAVFARMSVDQKQQLIQELKNKGFCVAMCGDGANDCGALRTAHAGISLSDAEASVASPFTAKDPNISCVPKIVTEGRAALTTSFSILKFIVASSMLQFTGAIILYLIYSNLTDGQYLYCNIVILFFAFVFGATKSSRRPLGKIPPHKSILSLEPLLSLIFQILINWTIQACAMYWIRQFDWYEPFHPKFTDYGCYEEFAVFTVSALQYPIIAVMFSKGEPYRRPFYTNKTFVVFILILTALSLYVDFACPNFLMSFFEFKKLPPSDFDYVVLILSGANLVAAFVFEEIIITIISNTNRKYSTKSLNDDNIDLVTNKILIAS